jgi:hypothetical protein
MGQQVPALRECDGEHCARTGAALLRVGAILDPASWSRSVSGAAAGRPLPCLLTQLRGADHHLARPWRSWSQQAGGPQDPRRAQLERDERLEALRLGL